MGIKSFYNLVKDYAPNCLLEYNFSELYGYRLAVDISIFLYKYIRSAGSEKWVEVFIIFLCELKKNGIKTVCIFDGPNPPIEKKGEQEDRRKNSQKIIHRKDECIKYRDKLNELIKQDDYELSEQFIDECRILIRPKRGHPDVTDYNNPQDIINSLINTIERLEKQTISINKSYGEKAFEIVKLMGMTAIQADGEAEALCSYLACHNLVDGVLSEDTDVLAYGTPLFFAFKKFRLKEKRFIGIHLPSLLEELSITFEEFQDLCILLSCDYNQRIKGIGSDKAFSLIKKYGKIENMESIYDTDCLIYKRCRELFTVPKKIDYKIPPNQDPDYLRLDEFFKKNKIVFGVDYIKSILSPKINIIMDE